MAHLHSGRRVPTIGSSWSGLAGRLVPIPVIRQLIVGSTTTTLLRLSEVPVLILR